MLEEDPIVIRQNSSYMNIKSIVERVNIIYKIRYNYESKNNCLNFGSLNFIKFTI